VSGNVRLAVPWQCHISPRGHGSLTPLPWHFLALPWRRHDTATALSLHCPRTTMALPRHCQGSAMAPAMTMQWHCCGIFMSVRARPWQCRGNATPMPWRHLGFPLHCASNTWKKEKLKVARKLQMTLNLSPPSTLRRRRELLAATPPAIPPAIAAAPATDLIFISGGTFSKK
jgi:hypothetical protein